MRALVASILLVCILRVPALAASVEKDQISAQELAEELRFKTRKVIFNFDSPVYARADFVQVKAGQAVHNESATSHAQVKIPFFYILRDIDPKTESVSLQIGDASRTTYQFERASVPSARVHDIYPKLTLPSAEPSETPI